MKGRFRLIKIDFQKFYHLIGIALIVAVMGIMPHIIFSLQMGEISYFKSAYDEEFYTDIAIHGVSVPYRFVAAVFMKILYFVSDNNIEKTLIISDFVFPFLCCIAVGLIAYFLTDRIFQRILIMIFLLFGQELLSLGSSAIWTNPTKMWSLTFWRTQLPPWGEIIIPDYFTSYFSLFRSPEPQISYIILFLYLAFLSKYFAKPQKLSSRWDFIIGLIFLDTLLALLYVFIGFSLIFFKIAFAASLCFIGRKKISLYLIASCLYVLAIAWVIYMNDFNGSNSLSSGGYVSLVFSSHLPSITPSVLLSVVMIVVLFVQRRHIENGVIFILSLISISMPLIFTNQQIITGIMISAKEWERYTNYPFLVFGISLFLSSVKWNEIKISRRMLQAITITLVICLSYLLFVGQKNTYEQWYASNELSVAQKRATVAAIHDPQFSQVKFLIEEPGLEPLLEIRLNKPVHFITDYNQVFLSPILDMPPDGSLPSNQSLHRNNLFEFFARIGKTPSEALTILKNEAMQKSGWYLGFLFSFNDFWYPNTDSRLVRQKQILENIDLIISAYKDYLKTPNQHWVEPTILLSKKAPQEIGVNPIWNNRLVAEGVAGQSKVYAYVQDIQSD